MAAARDIQVGDKILNIFHSRYGHTDYYVGEVTQAIYLYGDYYFTARCLYFYSDWPDTPVICAGDDCDDCTVFFDQEYPANKIVEMRNNYLESFNDNL